MGALAVAAGVAAAAVGTGTVEIPDVGAALSDASSSLGAWAYLVVPALAFLETAAFVGLLVPGETAVLVGGVVAQRGGVSLIPLIALVSIAAIAGDLVSFSLGRRIGTRFLLAYGPKLRISPAQIERVERFFEDHGPKAVVAGRFVGVVRPLMPFVAGASSFPLRRFLPYSATGALAWATAFTLIGYAFSDSFDTVGSTLTWSLIAAAGLAAAITAALAHRRN